VFESWSSTLAVGGSRQSRHSEKLSGSHVDDSRYLIRLETLKFAWHRSKMFGIDVSYSMTLSIAINSQPFTSPTSDRLSVISSSLTSLTDARSSGRWVLLKRWPQSREVSPPSHVKCRKQWQIDFVKKRSPFRHLHAPAAPVRHKFEIRKKTRSIPAHHTSSLKVR